MLSYLSLSYISKPPQACNCPRLSSSRSVHDATQWSCFLQRKHWDSPLLFVSFFSLFIPLVFVQIMLPSVLFCKSSWSLFPPSLICSCALASLLLEGLKDNLPYPCCNFYWVPSWVACTSFYPTHSGTDRSGISPQPWCFLLSSVLFLQCCWWYYAYPVALLCIVFGDTPLPHYTTRLLWDSL